MANLYVTAMAISTLTLTKYEVKLCSDFERPLKKEAVTAAPPHPACRYVVNDTIGTMNVTGHNCFVNLKT